MTRTDIRTLNLRAIIQRLIDEGHNKKEAAARLDLSPSYLSQLLKGKKIGDDVARKLEGHLHLTEGAFDQPLHEGVVNTAAIPVGSSQSRRLDRDTLQQAIEVLEHLADLQKAPTDLCHDAKAILIAYDVVAEFGPADNVFDLTKRIAAKLRGNGNGESEERSSAA